MSASVMGLRSEMVDGNLGDFYSEGCSMDDESDHDVCDLCEDDHETRDCDQGWCRNCSELLDNCDCDEPDEATAEEYVAEKLGLRR